MKTKTCVILSINFALTLFCATAIYGHVIDLEYVSPADRYDLDRDGRDFFEWLNDEFRKEEERDQWVKDLVQDVAWEVAASFDPRLGDRD